MKLLRWFLTYIVIFVLVLVGLYVFGKTGPIASSSSERVLKQNISILGSLGFGVDINSCKYKGPSTLMGTSNPSFECVTTKSFNDSSANEAVKQAAKFLQNAGWQGSTENFKYDPRKIQFFKGDLSILVEPYYWQSGSTRDSYRFLILFSRMTLWKPTWAM